MQSRDLRDRMVAELAAAGRIRSPHIAAAFRAVPREMFLPGVELSQVYRNEAIVTREDADGRPVSSSSQPSIMAEMLQQLGVGPGHRVLEIGAGTGYNAAVLAHLVGATGRVVTVDIDEDVARQAREHLNRADLTNVKVITADGTEGWSPGAPYDRIILTASAADLSPAWTAQLSEGGRLVLPLSLRGMQRSVAFRRVDDHLSSISIVNCGFMPLRGLIAGPETTFPLGVFGTFVKTARDRRPDTRALQSALARPGTPIPAAVDVPDADLLGGLGLWVMLRENDAALLNAVGAATEADSLPVSVRFVGMTIAVAVLGKDSLAALVRTSPAGGIAVQPFGASAAAPTDRLLSCVREWAANGRRGTADLSIRAYPHPADVDRAHADAVIDLPHARLTLHFDSRDSY